MEILTIAALCDETFKILVSSLYTRLHKRLHSHQSLLICIYVKPVSQCGTN